MFITEKDYKKFKIVKSIKCKAINILILATAWFVLKYSRYGYSETYYRARIWTDSPIANLIMTIPFLIVLVLLAVLHYSLYRDKMAELDKKWRTGKLTSYDLR